MYVELAYLTGAHYLKFGGRQENTYWAPQNYRLPGKLTYWATWRPNGRFIFLLPHALRLGYLAPKRALYFLDTSRPKGPRQQGISIAKCCFLVPKFGYVRTRQLLIEVFLLSVHSKTWINQNSENQWIHFLRILIDPSLFHLEYYKLLTYFSNSKLKHFLIRACQMYFCYYGTQGWKIRSKKKLNLT